MIEGVYTVKFYQTMYVLRWRHLHVLGTHYAFYFQGYYALTKPVILIVLSLLCNQFTVFCRLIVICDNLLGKLAL